MTNMTQRIAWIAAAVVFAMHALGNAHYGFFRDELYFIICGRHPQWGYVDQPPIVPLLAALTQIGGHSLWLLRIVPALFAAGGAYVTVLLAAEYGGGAFAQSFAALIYCFTGVLLSFGGKVGTDEVGLLTWPLIALLVVRITKGADPRWWLAAGALAGISFESKYSVLFFLVALVTGLLLTAQRRILWNRWHWLGVAAALLIALPNVLWQAQHGFPMWELLQAGQNGKNVIVGPALYIVQELLITNPFLAPVWIVGVVWLFRQPQLRFLGWLYVLLIGEMIVFHGKHYYPANVYPIVIAAGAVPIEAWTKRTSTRIAYCAYACVFGLLFLPLSLPVLPVPAFFAYQTALAKLLPVPRAALATEHDRELSPLPGDWADMHGWPELAATVASIYNALSPDERAKAVVFGGNYGEAAAVQFFAPGIPVISSHNQYWLWGPAPYDGSIMIQINGTCWAKEGYFTSHTIAARTTSPYAISYEHDIPINICRGLKIPVARLWTESKNYE
jgi:4-amino-4-deoxy-L-arabinose transferase-like glycosyltransferase